MLFPSVPDISSLATGGLANVIVSSINNKNKFTDINTTITIILIVIIIIYILLLMSVYKLTDSGVQALLFFLFGGLYLAIALIYYGFSGYRIIKRS